MEKKVFKIGLLGFGGKLKIENGFLSYQNPYARTFRVQTKDIETVTVDVKGWGKGILKIIGHGAELASAEMPIGWANKSQAWILENK
ncbi:MAG: hypothetical protein WC410_03645 [Candidatus Paceibacterota bacterium]|jgi:hypothetical protein